MNRRRVLLFGTILIFAMTTGAKQATKGPDDASAAASSETPGVPSVASQLKLLSERLELTNDQQQKVKPILEELHDATVKVVKNESLSKDERLQKVWPLRSSADEKIRTILTEDQKKKLDQLEQEPHPELHGNLSGALLAPLRHLG